MRVFSATVKQGAIVSDTRLDLPEGSTVTIVADSGDERFDLTADEEELLLESIAEAERGDVVPAAELLSRLAR